MKAEEYKKRINVKANSIDQTVGSLSGGNQQKVVLQYHTVLSHINIDPEKFTTHIYYSDGTVSGTVVGAESSRILATSEQIPKVISNARINFIVDCLVIFRLRTQT